MNSERARALDRPPRAAQRQVRIVHQFQAEGADVLHRRLHGQLHGVLGGRIALRQQRAVFLRDIALPPVEMSSTSGRTTVHSG
jgi:hypothetical protein